MKLVMRIVLAAALAGAAAGACAQQDARQSRERELLRRQSAQMRELEAEKTTLEQAQARLGDEKAALERELQTTRKKAALEDVARARLAQTERELDSARADFARQREQQAASERDAAARIVELEARLADADARANRLGASLTEREREVAACSARNQQLAQTGRDILDRLTDGRCGKSSDFSWDPFVQSGRVRFDNALEDYRDKIADQRYGHGPPH